MKGPGKADKIYSWVDTDIGAEESAGPGVGIRILIGGSTTYTVFLILTFCVWLPSLTFPYSYILYLYQPVPINSFWARLFGDLIHRSSFVFS
jgi:hypothetical protein